MSARQSAPILLKFGVAALFLCGIGFGAVAALSQPDGKAKSRPTPEVAKPEPSTPTAAPAPEPKLEPKVELKTPEVKPEPKKTEPPKPEVKKPEPKPELPKSSPVTFQQVQRVLKTNCVVCHGDPLIKAKLDLRTLDSIKKRDGLVVPGDPEASDLYGSIKGGNASMPPPDAKTKLTDAEKKIIKDWIAGGAK